MTPPSPSAGPRRRGIFILGSVTLILLLLVAFIAFSRSETPRGRTVLPSGRAVTLKEAGWEVTSEGDFEEKSVEAMGERLRFRIATRHTRSDTVKFLGVRRLESVSLKPGTRIGVDIDWNGQSNGSGLSAGLVLSPDKTSSNPLQLPENVWLEFIGVPPGKTVRRVIGVRTESRHRHLDMEGWPDRNREGRVIGLRRMEIEILEGGAFRVSENGEEVLAAPTGTLTFEKAHLYLQVSSRTNYPPRELYFGQLRVTPPR